MQVDNLSVLKIHKFKNKEQYERAYANGEINETDVCLTPDEQHEYSWNDLTDRPFYEGEPEERLILPEIVVEDSSSLEYGMWTLAAVRIEVGETYEVLYNDEIYTVECYEGDIGPSIGDVNIQEYPFYLFDGGWATMLKFIPQTEPLKFCIKSYTVPIKKLERKFVEGIVGMDVEGRVFEYDGKQYTAQRYAEVFNDDGNIAVGYASHAEGYATKALGTQSHAEGYSTVAKGSESHTEGNHTIASGENQHVQGRYNIEDTENKYAHIVGNGDSGSSIHGGKGRSNAHTLDWDGNAWYQGIVKVGGTSYNDGVEVALKTDIDNIDLSDYATKEEITETYETKEDAQLKYDELADAKADWNQNDENAIDYIKNRPFYEGEPEIHYNLPETTISDESSLSLGFTYLQGTLSIEDGRTYEVIINGNVYTAKCVQIDSSGFTLGDKNLQEYPFYFLDRGMMYQIKYGVQEAPITIAVRTYINSIKKLERKFIDRIAGMDVEGEIFPYQDKNYIAGNGAEIFNSYLTNKALGQYSHAEGESTNAIGFASHVEGCVTTAYGMYTHAEGLGTKAYGDCSHTEGWNTIASDEYQHVQGKYNIEDAEGEYAHIIGNGTADDKRSNAHTVDWNGNAWFTGDVYVGSTSGTNKDDGSKKLATEEYVDTAVTNLVDSSLSDQIAFIDTEDNEDVNDPYDGGIIVVDSELSLESENPIQNGAVSREFNKFGGTVEITSGNPEKTNTVLTLDPSSESVNIYTAEEIDAKLAQLSREFNERFNSIQDGDEVMY